MPSKLGNSCQDIFKEQKEKSNATLSCLPMANIEDFIDYKKLQKLQFYKSSSTNCKFVTWQQWEKDKFVFIQYIKRCANRKLIVHKNLEQSCVHKFHAHSIRKINPKGARHLIYSFYWSLGNAKPGNVTKRIVCATAKENMDTLPSWGSVKEKTR